jgi:hypothetical protein
MVRRAYITLVLVALASSCALYGGDDGDDDGVAACEWMGRTYQDGERFPAGDNCNSCSCEDGQVACTLIACLDGGVPDASGACQPTQGCAEGPACGGVCCDTGEQCVNDACRCGQNPACGAGDSCAAAGPIGGDACGAICCGASGPCPQ